MFIYISSSPNLSPTHPVQPEWNQQHNYQMQPECYAIFFSVIKSDEILYMG